MNEVIKDKAIKMKRIVGLDFPPEEIAWLCDQLVLALDEIERLKFENKNLNLQLEAAILPDEESK